VDEAPYERVKSRAELARPGIPDLRDALDRDLGHRLLPPVQGRVEVADTGDARVPADQFALGIAHERVAAAGARDEGGKLVVPLAPRVGCASRT
jgi:hypothetical protein